MAPKTMREAIAATARKGRYGADGVKDTKLAHINADEAAILEARNGHPATVNPETGVDEYALGGGAGFGPQGAKGPQAGRGGGGAKGGQGGAGSAGSGAGSTGGNDAAMGGSSGPLGSKDPRPTNMLDKLFGYDTVEDREAAYANNPAVAGNKPGATMIASFPQASIGYALAQLADGVMGMANPLAGALGSAYRATGVNSGDFDGPFTDAAEALGASKGPQGPDVAGPSADAAGGQKKGNVLGGSKKPATNIAAPPTILPTGRVVNSSDPKPANVPFSAPGTAIYPNSTALR